MKPEIKEEEFDDFLQEYLSANQTVEENPGMECEIKAEMYTSPTMTLKEEKYSPMEIKDEEEFDDFLQEYLYTCKTVEEKPGMDFEIKTEIYTSPTMKEEKYSPMEITDEEEFDLSEYGHHVSSPTSKLLVHHYMLCIVTLLEF